MIPSGVYKDLGATGLRRMLFERTRVDSLVSLSNEKFIFDEVHHSFGITFLNFTKGGKTETASRRRFASIRARPISADAFESFVHDESNFVELTAELVSCDERGDLRCPGVSQCDRRGDRRQDAAFPALGKRLDGHVERAI